MTWPACPGCFYRQMQPVPVAQVTRCEQCGFGFTAEDGTVAG
jgi:hypothetical protein